MAQINISQPGGAGSLTANGTILTSQRVYPTFSGTTTSFAWSLTATPSGSATTMLSGSGGAPYFDPDIEGRYDIQLIGTGGADAGTYTFTVFAQKQAKPASAKLLYGYEPVPIDQTGSTVISMGTGVSGLASFFPFQLPADVVAHYMQMCMSMSFSTLGNSSGQQTHSVSWGIYTRGLAANSTSMSQLLNGSFTMGVTGNNSTYSINQPTTTSSTGYGTGSTTSAGSNISSGYTGAKLVQFPVNSTLSAGQYYLGLWGGMSTSSIIVGVSNSFLGYNNGPSTIATMAPIGSFSSDFSTGTILPGGAGGPWNLGCASFSTANLASLPATVAFSNLTGNIVLTPYLKFVATQ